VKVEFDPAKNAQNIAERGISFERAEEFDWDTALVAEDTRKQYPERRFEGIGYVGRRLYVLVFARIEKGFRVISFRKANRREERRYEKARKS
jgi:uncharacterized protein